MDYQEPVTVYTLKDAAIAELLRIMLENEGIPCRLENEGQAGLTGVLDVKVQVRAVDAERATQLIQAHEHFQQEHLQDEESNGDDE